MCWRQPPADASSWFERMVELSLVAITAMKDAQQEGFIASTLYSQGWNITQRALDCDDLIASLNQVVEPKPVLLLSTDLPGLTHTTIAEFRSRGFTLFLFAANPDVDREFTGVTEFPTTALELMALMRGSLRAPLIRPSKPGAMKTAQTIAFAAASHGAGCTLLAINMATELSLLGSKTLLVDADAATPAISLVLGHRGLRDDCLRISENLWATEISQSNTVADITRLHEAQSQYQFILLDLGTIPHFATSLTSRRWESEALIWVSQNADHLCCVTEDGEIALGRLRNLMRDLTQNSIRPALSIIHNMRQPGKRNNRDESLLQSVRPIKQSEIMQIPYDPRSAERAENNHSALYEVNQKSALRRAIVEMTGRFTQ